MIMEADTVCATLEDVHKAADRLKGIVYHTPLLRSLAFSERYGYKVSFKLENMQKTGAFKLRGAYNKIASLSPAERAHGLIAASSGNHAQGVAYAARAFDLDENTRIFIPSSTPAMKIEKTRRYGSVNIVMVDGNYDMASEIAHAEASESGATYIEPYDDWAIIAGQGTIGLEIMQDAPQTQAIVCPIGGGGLIAGIALAARAISPALRISAVGASYAQQSGYTIADGIRVKRPGQRSQLVMDEHIDTLVRVNESQITEAIRLVKQLSGLSIEGSAAVGIAALEAGLLHYEPNTELVVVISGGNIDPQRFQEIMQTP